MLNLFKKYLPSLIMLVLYGVLIWWIDDAKLSIPIEWWDNVATIGWSMLPLGMCWALAAFALNLREYRSKVAADTVHILAQAALAEASMWAVRHQAKRERSYSRQ
jgi:hypothetical protein